MVNFEIKMMEEMTFEFLHALNKKYGCYLINEKNAFQIFQP